MASNVINHCMAYKNKPSTTLEASGCISSPAIVYLWCSADSSPLAQYYRWQSKIAFPMRTKTEWAIIRKAITLEREGIFTITTFYELNIVTMANYCRLRIFRVVSFRDRFFPFLFVVAETEIHQILFSVTTNKNGKKRSGNETTNRIKTIDNREESALSATYVRWIK